MAIYTEGVMADGACILKDGEKMTIAEVLAELNAAAGNATCDADRMEKPRVRFCWVCSRKLRGNHFAEILIDEHMKIVHKACAEYARVEMAKEREAELGLK